MADKIEISHITIIFTLLFIILLWFLYFIRDVLLLLFVSFVAMSALNPVVNKMENLKIPRPVAILLIYILGFGILGGLVAMLTPVFVQQTTLLIEKLPNLINKLNIFNIPIKLSDYGEQLIKIPGNVVKILALTFNGLLRFFTFLVITFYLLMERKNMDKHLRTWFLRDGEERAEKFVNKMERRIGGWVRGELLLMLIVGFLSYIGLFLLDLEFAVPLAVLAGLLELIPNIGPTVSMIPAALVGLSISPIMGLTVVVLYFLIQQLENNFIVPKVMQKSVGLNPLVTLTSLMVGLKLGGAMGMLLAVPVYLALEIIVKEIYKSRISSA